MQVLKIFRVLDLLRSSLSLVQIVGLKYLIVCLPHVIVLNLGIESLSSFEFICYWVSFVGEKLRERIIFQKHFDWGKEARILAS